MNVPVEASVETSLTARLSRNTITLLVSNAGGAVLLFVLSALIGRSLGTEGLGIYAVVLAWIFPLSLIVEFGLGTLMTRDIPQDVRQAHAYLETVTRARLLIGGTIMLMLIAAAPLISHDPLVIAGLHVSAPLVIIPAFYGEFTAIFKARGDMRPIPYLTIGMLLAQAILTALVLLANGGVLAVLVVNVITSAGQLVAAWALYRRRFYAPVQAQVIALKLAPLLRRAFPFALAAFFAALQTRLSAILLESLATTADVGHFSAASRFIEAARVIPNAFYGALFPALAALAAEPALMARTFRRGMLGLSAYGLAAGVGFMVIAPPLLTLTYGDAFAPAAPVLQTLGWLLLFSLPRGGRTLYLYALGQEQRVNRVNGIVILLQIVFSLLLIPSAGAVGAAVVHVLIELAALILLWRDPPPAAS